MVKLTLRIIIYKLLWCVSTWSDSVKLLVRQIENSTSEQGSFKERSLVGSWFSELLFLDVPGTATEQIRTCEFRKKFIKFRQSTQNAWLRPAKFLEKFF